MERYRDSKVATLSLLCGKGQREAEKDKKERHTADAVVKILTMERKATNEWEFLQMRANIDRQSDFFKMIFPIIERYNNVSIGRPIGMSVYNAIIDLFNEKLRPIFEDYAKLKKEKEICKQWFGRGKQQDASLTPPKTQSFEDVFPPNPNGYWLL